MNDTSSFLLEQALQDILPGARLAKYKLPDIEGLSLLLIDSGYPVDKLDSDNIQRIMNNPLYWILCWASGLVLARFILSHPELVKNRHVMDIGSGSGVVALACAKSGAKKVIASDIDELARQAILTNARLNGLDIEVVGDFRTAGFQADIITVADLLYDKSNFSLLDDMIAFADDMILADARVRNFSYPGLRHTGCYPGETFPCLGGFDEFKEVNIYQKVK